MGDPGEIAAVSPASIEQQDSAGQAHVGTTPSAAEAILAAVHDAVISTSADGIILTWNAAAERIYGYAAVEAVGRGLALLFFPDEASTLDTDLLQPTRRTGRHETFSRTRKRDGTDVYVSFRLTLTGNTEGYVLCATEETAYAAAGRELQRRREELQTILDTVPAFIWFKDADNRILRANRLAAHSLNMTSREMEGRSTYELYPEEAKKYHLDDLEVIRTGIPKLGILERLYIDGHELWVTTDKIPYRDATGNNIGVIVFSVDVTERVLAEEALRRAHDELEARVIERTAELARTAENLRAEMSERKKAEEQIRRREAELAHMQRIGTVESIAAQLAHEMNQPLAAIVNFARGLKRRLQDGTNDVEPLIHVTDQISNQAIRAAHVVQRLREFIGKHPPRRTRCDLGRIITDAAGLIDTEARRRNVRVRTVLDPQLDPVEIDQVQIEQVVINLIRNALDATTERVGEAGAEVLVRTRRNGPWIETDVVDEGCGLPPESVEDMFEPYFTTKHKGLGMGLAISRNIIAAHGGTLQATANDGPGATFTFTLPCD